MDAVLIEGDCVLNFAGHGPDVNVDANTMETIHKFVIEVSDRHRFERDAFDTAITGLDYEPVIDKIKDDIERSSGIGHC
jgi:hypothetical protein